ncbi:YbfB/YjiJ family MFS transporter [Paenibacillus sp. NPDC058071]|uniref:YbfB/YjiJ family MFS transporter n=1 Tax=Paenibacillus sp. NPDC058071 TaxID=3346326 RepID=UPI0036DD2695
MDVHRESIVVCVLTPDSDGEVESGGTFMGITMLFVAYAKDLFPQNNKTIIGLLTTFFGFGQILVLL